MHYEFPYISHLDEVREVIQELPEFIIAEREWGYVANYLVSHPDTFPQVKTAGGSAKMRNEALRAKAIRRECRGLIFDRNGTLISRPFHKFFNVNERNETQSHLIDLDQPHVILEKLDGCLSADTMVETPYGNMPMKDICESDTEIPVRAYDHASRQDVWAQVQGKSIKESTDNWYRVTLHDGRSIELTDNHKVWCVNKGAYLTVADLEEGDEVQSLND